MSGVALVVGGTGAIGPALVSQLLAGGWRVRTFSRSGGVQADPASCSEHHTGDVRDPDAVGRAMAGVDLVFHLAARLHSHADGPTQLHEMRAVNVDGTATIARAARAAAVQRLVYFSSINVYGPTHRPAVANEDTVPAPATAYAQSKLDAERVVAECGIPFVILRPAAVYGPKVQGGYATLVRAIAGGFFVAVGDGRNRRTLVFVDDLARAAVAAATAAGAVGRIVNVTDGRIHELCEIIAAISQASGRRGPIATLPLPLVRTPFAAAAAIPGLRGMGRRALSLVDKLTEDVAVSGNLMSDALRVRPTIDLQDGWRRTLGASQRPSDPTTGA